MITKEKIVKIFTSIFFIFYMIIPYYFYLFNIKFIYIWSFIGILIILLLSKKIYVISNIKFRGLAILFICLFLIRFLIYCYDGEIIAGLLYLINSILIIYLFIPIINTRKRFLNLINAIIFIAGIISILGIVEEVFRINVFSFFNTIDITLNYNPLRFGMLRIISFHSHSIIYCLWIMFMLSLIYYAISIPENSKKKNLYKIIYILLILNALMTLSRSSIIAIVVCQFILLYKTGFKVLIKKIIQIFILMLLIVLFSKLFIPNLYNLITNSFEMVYALFDDSHSEKIASDFGNDNLSGIGNRLQLYSWVLDDMSDNKLWGMGVFKEFAYAYKNSDGYRTYKTSIEVQYLNVLYHFGIIGLITEIVGYLILIIMALKLDRKPASWEGKISFNSVFLITLLIYCINLFVVNSSTERNTFYLLIVLFMAYSFNNKFIGNGKDYEK